MVDLSGGDGAAAIASVLVWICFSGGHSRRSASAPRLRRLPVEVVGLNRREARDEVGSGMSDDDGGG